MPNEQDTRRRVWRRAQSRPTHLYVRDGEERCPTPAQVLPLLPQAMDPGPQSTPGMDVTVLFAPLAGLLENDTPPIHRVVPDVTNDVLEVLSVHPKGRIHVAVPVGGLHVST